MIQIDPFIGGLLAEFIVAITATFGGIAIKSLYDWSKKKFRLRHMRNIFGDVDELRDQVRFVIPVFKPLTYDDFAEGEKSYMSKDFITNAAGTKMDHRQVPMYSECLVIDDYLAFKKIEDLFVEYDYGTLEFCDDIQALRDWRKELIMCFGGPRSNQKLRQILNQEAIDFMEIYDLGDLLSDWTFTYNVRGETATYRATEDIAYAYIAKMQNPYYEDGHVLAIAGDSAFSTDMAARYAAENIVKLSKTFGRHNFILLLKSNRDMYETVKPEAQIILDDDADVHASTKQ